MDWPAILAVFVACHLAGDFLLQTQWQAENKRGGLGPDSVSRQALLSHVIGYGAAFLPAFIWLWSDLGAAVLLVAVVILLPHLVQDDGRLLSRYITAIKKANAEPHGIVFVAADQSFHFIALLLTALLARGLS